MLDSGGILARPKKNSNLVSTDIRILVAAEQAFGQNGFVRTRLEDIAKSAGIRRPSLLYHFSTKEELYFTVVRSMFDDLKKTLLGAMGKGTYSEQIIRLASEFIFFVDNRPSFAATLLREMIDGNGPAHDILKTEIVPVLDMLEQYIKIQGQDRLPEGVSIRAAILQLSSDVLLRTASGNLREELWGEECAILPLVRQMFIGKE
jgi:AcrR family transcriptional regulator